MKTAKMIGNRNKDCVRKNREENITNNQQLYSKQDFMFLSYHLRLRIRRYKRQRGKSIVRVMASTKIQRKIYLVYY